MRLKLIYVNIASYFGLLVANFLAVKIPFFGKTPGDVSDLFPTLLTPASFAFKIWWIVYLLLGVFAFYQVKLLVDKKDPLPSEVSAMGYLFLISSVLNLCWLLAWQSMHIAWAFVLIFLLWIVLILIYYRLAKLESEKWYYTIPFSVYLAWVCIAALANLNVLLIDSGFAFFSLTEEQWTACLIGLGICGTFFVLYVNQDLSFALVIIWAFFGIYVKNRQTASEGSWVVFMSWLALVILLVVATGLGLKRLYDVRSRKELLP